MDHCSMWPKYQELQVIQLHQGPLLPTKKKEMWKLKMGNVTRVPAEGSPLARFHSWERCDHQLDLGGMPPSMWSYMCWLELSEVGPPHPDKQLAATFLRNTRNCGLWGLHTRLLSVPCRSLTSCLTIASCCSSCKTLDKKKKRNSIENLLHSCQECCSNSCQKCFLIEIPF